MYETSYKPTYVPYALLSSASALPVIPPRRHDRRAPSHTHAVNHRCYYRYAAECSSANKRQSHQGACLAEIEPEFHIFVQDRSANRNKSGSLPRSRLVVTNPANFFEAHFLDRFRLADQQARVRRVATRPGSTVVLVANESINQHFKSPAENFCRW